VKVLVIQLFPLLVDDPKADSLFVEVDADVLHGGSPFVETRFVDHHSGLPRFQRSPPVGVGLLHSFTQISRVISANAYFDSYTRATEAKHVALGPKTLQKGFGDELSKRRSARLTAGTVRRRDAKRLCSEDGEQLLQ
jgi:hypothetical protein